MSQEVAHALPPGYYQLEQAVTTHVPHLRPAQRRGLVLWATGASLAKCARQHAVLAALA